MTIDPGLVPLAFLVMTVLALLTIPLAAAVFFAGVLLLYLNPDPLPQGFMLSYSLAMRFNSPALISIPLFALAGELAVAAGITERLLNVADVLGGRGRHAVGARTILGCTLFASVSGVGPAAVTAEGKRLIPEMLRAGYSREAAAGAIACAAGLSIIIPASIPLTIYAGTVGIQTNIVFTASFFPGLLVAAALLGAMCVYSRLRLSERKQRSLAFGRRVLIVRDAAWSLLMPVLVLSSLFTGFFTAPEAAAFASAYAIGVGAFVHRSIRWLDVREALARAAVTASTVLLMAGVGGLFVMLMDACGFSARMGDDLYRLAGGRLGSILLMNVVLLFAGCFMDMPAIITLLAPLLLPLAGKCGLSIPHFGVMVVINIAIGLVTPPQAYNIAAAAKEAGVGIWAAARAAVPFLATMLVCLMVVAYLPELSLWLPLAFGWVF